MIAMTEDFKSPFPFAAFATPEDIRKASEQAMNLWIGALSPMWVPFLAASGFGLTAYSAGKTLQKELLEDMPLAARWPGFTPLWGQHDFTPESFEAPAEAVVETAAEAVESGGEPVVEAARMLTDVAETAVKPVQAMTEVVMDPVTETPVVPAVVEAIAEPVLVPEPAPVAPAMPDIPAPAPKAAALKPVTPPKPVAPKPIARELAVAKAKPASVAKPAPVAKSAPVAKPVVKTAPAKPASKPSAPKSPKLN